MDTTLSALFGSPGLFYSDIIEQILPRLNVHEYHFTSDEWFQDWVKSDNFDLATSNGILALELIDKAHLAATTALFRTKRWVTATCLAYDNQNLVAWASSVRGFIENAGDIMDGIRNVSTALAENHASISSALSGQLSTKALDCTEIERILDHFVFAKWMRASKADVRKAKDNIEYVRELDLGKVPKIIEFYQKLCGITHPSSSSIDYIYVPISEGFKLDFNRDKTAIDELCHLFPMVLARSLMYACNPPLLTLRVLHRFGHHPRLPELKKLNWKEIPEWAKIEPALNRYLAPPGARVIRRRT
jgi:hypothetical protein